MYIAINISHPDSKGVCNIPHFKAYGMINLQYEIKIWKTILNKATNDKI